MVLERFNVSNTGFLSGKLSSSHVLYIKPISKEALCATIVESPIKSIKSGITDSIFGESLTILLVIPVKFSISYGITPCGLIKE